MNETDGALPAENDSPSGFSGIPTLIARFAVGGLFVKFGLAKLADPIQFLKLVKNYDILPLEPAAILNVTAVALPSIEIVIGILLIFGVARRAGGVICFGMMVVFTAAVLKLALDYQVLHPEIAFTAIRLDCGCGGGEINVALKLVENVGLVLASGFLALSKSHRFAWRPFG